MMTLSQTNEELRSDGFYSPICASGYLTPLQRKKLREKRNINLSPNATNESEILKNPKGVSKGIKKAKTKRNQKSKSNGEIVKKVLKQKDNFPHLQCSIADLVGQNKDSLKEKRFFKNRSPQHLKKAKFIMPLTCKKGLEFISSPLLSPNLKQKSHNISTKETSADSLELDNFGTCVTENESNSSKGNVSSDSNVEIKEDVNKSNSSSQVSENEMNTDCDKNLNLESKQITYEMFEFDYPSDEYLLERENRAREQFKESLAASKSDSSFDYLNESMDNIVQTTPPKKLFPIFNKSRQIGEEQFGKQLKKKKKSLNITDKSKGSEQLIIDAGQKEIGAKMCKTCGMIYTIGQEEDEKLHANYHEAYLINLKFKGWKKERVVGEFLDGRVIQVKDTDENFRSKKIKDILFVVNRDLGFSTVGLPSRTNAMILLFISTDQRVNGCLVAEGIQSASRVVSSEIPEEKDGKTIWKLGSWYASSEKVPAICGVNRVWVSREFRRQKVASRLVDCLRRNFLYAYVVDFHELAFTDPTIDGRNFAASYTGTDNFLVYK